MLQERQILDERLELRQQLLRHEQRLGPAVGQHVLVIFRRQQRVDRDRHDAGLDGAEERHRPIDGIMHRDEDAVFHAHVHRQQRAAEAIDPFREFAERILPAVVDVGGLAGAACLQIAADQVFGGVVVAWNIDCLHHPSSFRNSNH